MNLNLKSLFLTAPAILALAPAGFAQTKAAADKNNLVANGDFESGEKSPEGWQPVDGLTTFWVNDPGGKSGKVIKIDTDIYADQAYGWWKTMHAGGSAAGAPVKRPTSGNKYDTIAGLDGVHYYSEFFPIKPGVAYKLTCDFRGKWADGNPPFVPKLWLRAYKDKIPNDKFGVKDMGDENAGIRDKKPDAKTATGGAAKDSADKGKKAVPKPYDYQMDLVCRGESQDTGWSHIERDKPIIIPNRAQYKEIKWARICLYAYWPPGIYYFDNVKLVEIGAEK